MVTYEFRNQHNNLLYSGLHQDETSAWVAFWDECKYPDWARDADECLRGKIRVETTED